jgi:hypothetical protein
MTDIAIVGGVLLLWFWRLHSPAAAFGRPFSSGMLIQRLRRASTQIDPTQLTFPDTDSGRCAT